MNLSKEMIPKFERFLVSTRGCKILKAVQKGELIRTMIGETIVIIREHDLRRTADGVELFCSDKDLLKELEEDFAIWLLENE